MRSKGMINNYVAHRLREVRDQKKLSTQEMSRRTGIAAGSYSCLENGWYRINLDNLFRILQGLEADVKDVWPEFEEDPGESIDENYLQRAVRASMERRPRPIDLDDIFEAVSGSFDIGKDKLQSKIRNWSRLTQARAACALLARESSGITMTSLSSSLGCSLSSISHLARRYADRLEEDTEFSSRVGEAREKLKRIADGNVGDTSSNGA